MKVAEIYTEFRQSLLSFIQSKVRSREDAEDILQNVFVKISSGINKLSDNEKLTSWVYTITRNSIIDYYRADRSKRNVVVNAFVEKNMPEEGNPDPTGGLDQCMNAMINLLPDDYRNVIIDSEIKGIKQKELASKYDMPYPSMRSRVQRGRERLKQLFYNCCHIQTDMFGNVMNVRSKSCDGGPCNPCNSTG
jgi:RNA polymerase sigma-70 factor (ECF subfamily)